jgi:predicted membrane channel-forming protein YqfA (hemolysin III family)
VSNRTWYIVGFTALSVAAAFLLPAMPQPPAYHDFADTRPAFGIGNFLDVVSNLVFLVVGIAGLAVVLRPATRFEHPAERWPYGIFFLGLALTAAGSAYYHLVPDNERLFWDRLPITITLMSLVAAQIVDRISVRAGLALLVPLLLAGAGSAVYWIATERAGAGNLMPYVVVQGYAMAILLVIAVLHPSRYTRGGDLYWVFAAYAIAKLLEVFDREVLALGGLVSGHTLKHVAAAVASVLVCRMLLRRTLLV